MIDPLVIDKAVDRFRKGKRNLESQCAHYGVRHRGARTTRRWTRSPRWRSAKALAERYPEVGEASPLELHRQQEQWKAASEEDFAAYRQRRGEAYVAEPGWPVRQRPGADEALGSRQRCSEHETPHDVPRGTSCGVSHKNALNLRRPTVVLPRKPIRAHRSQSR